MDPYAAVIPGAAAGSVAAYGSYGAPPMPPGVDGAYGGSNERGGHDHAHGGAERGGRQTDTSHALRGGGEPCMQLCEAVATGLTG